jgi:hypothetical protein
MKANAFNKLYADYNANKHLEQMRHQKTVDYFADIAPLGKILDVGERTFLTEKLEVALVTAIDSTTGDLDKSFTAPTNDYDAIFYIHTIEHQFNPLLTLSRLRELLAPSGKIYVEYPQRMKLLWTSHHYHEIDNYRFRQLVSTAGLTITKRTYWKLPRPFVQYFKGFRSLLRLFYERTVMYELVQEPFFNEAFLKARDKHDLV